MNGWFIDLELGQEQVVRVNGDVDFMNSSEFSVLLARAVEKGPKVVVDLSQAELLDSSALMALSEAAKQAQKAGVQVTLSGMSDGILRALQITGIAASLGLAMVKSERHRHHKDQPNLNRQDWRITESVVLAEPEMIFHLRDLGVSAAQKSGLDPQSIEDVRLALTEALTQILRATASSEANPNKICLRCMCCPSAFVMEVTGSSGRRKNDAINSIGFKLINALMDEVNADTGEQGSEFRLLKWIRRE
ncbi:MAG: STAS domain-containing protein [Armatimonadota bacterium]